MENELISLISEQIAADEIGNQITEKTRREVFGEIRSVTQSEFYNAAAAGLNPSIRIILADYMDYEGEKLLSCIPYGREEKLFTVIRTYRTGNTIELTCEEKLGDTDED